MRRVLIAVVALTLAGVVVWGLRLLAAESGTEKGPAVSPVLAPARIDAQADLPASGSAAAVRAGADSAAPAPLVDPVSAMPKWCPAGRIVGRVVDASGLPIAGASVDALGPCRYETIVAILHGSAMTGTVPSTSSLPLAATARSRGDGEFELSRVIAGCPLLLRVDSPDGRSQLRAGLAALQDETLDLGDIALPAWARVMGLVSDGSGHGIAGAEVLLGYPDDVFNDRLRRRGCDPLSTKPARVLYSLTTGEGGTFRFLNVPPVQQEIGVYAPGYAPWTSFLSPRPSRAQSEDVALAPGLRIRGTTVDERGSPVPGASVRAEGESVELTCTTSDPEGRFELVDLPAGPLTLHAFTDSASSDEVPADAGASGIELVLEADAKPHGLDVQVLDATGSPAHDFELWCAPDGAASAIGSYAGLSDGRVTLPFSFVLRGPIWALARGQSSPSITLTPGSLGQGPLCLRLQPSVPVEGRVIDAVTGASLAGAALDVRILDDVTSQPDPTWCDEEGQFRIDNVPPGGVEIRAVAAGHCDKVVSFGAGWPPTVELALVPSGTLVLDATPEWRRERGAATQVRVTSGTQRTVVQQDCSQVPCVLTALEPGRYVIEIESSGATMRRTTSKGVEVKAAEITRFDLTEF